MRKSFVVASVVLLLGCTQAQEAKQVVRAVQTQVASATPLADATVYSGEVRARFEADLGFRVPGKITARLVDVGAVIRKSQPLARLDPSDNQTSTDAARAAVSAARTDQQFAQAELERYRNLAEKNFVSKTVLDQKQATLDTARARLDQAEAQLALSRNQLAYTTLVSDQDGVVTAVNGEAGQVVAAGQPVVRVARTSEKEVLVSIPETRLASTRAAKTLLIRLWSDPDRTYKGALRELSPVADPATRTFAARVSILNAGPEVALGMTANVLLPGGGQAERRNLIVLPLTALYRKDDKAAVWVVDPKVSQVMLKPVSIGQYHENGVEIAQGIAAGDIVVTAGVNKLVEGQTVRSRTNEGSTQKAQRQ